MRGRIRSASQPADSARRLVGQRDILDPEPWGEDPKLVELSALRDSHEWVVTVRDNGVGVDPDQASRIFEMFSRANSEPEGVGIGLAVCRRIIEAHGGRIWVEAADGGGSAFRFTMPR